MMTGDRRWAPGRRTGMTVLGKVTVPKPINLPSQRLENHGLDPNVEIVPKGTLNWGTRSPSSAQIAWASPAQSPPKTGGIGSPSYLNGRPSSGGSGTRPSTAGSDRSHEPVPNVWGSSSRPSSASGVPVSNQTSLAAARPRSAEPRPASSQLSRFAEPISENSVAWGASGTMERLAISSTKSKDFSLSTGDFPTLGSEKTTESNLQQGHSSHGRPVSASGRTATPKQLSETSLCDDGSMDASKERGGVNTLQNNNILEVEPGDPPNTERWQRETKPFPDQNMPQQFGPWHGSLPHNPPNGVWYRGPYGGGPYGPPGPPGSYPHEPFAYYHPRFPARPAANLQPVLPPGTAPSGYFPDKGDSHRPHMPDSYVQPVMPFGPGPYPVQVQYDGYYGPPCAGSCIPNEQRPPVMGMATAPCVYNRYPMQNVHPDPGNFHGPSGYGSGSTRAKEQGGSSHLPGTRQGPYKLLKHQDGWDETDSKEKREHTVSVPCLERDSMPGTPFRETGQGANQGHGEQLSFSKASNVTAASQYADSHGGHSPVSVGMDLPERKFKDNRIDDSSVRKQEVESVPAEDPQKFMSKRNPTLIEKIESLNNKARMSDGRHEEKLKSLRVFSAKAEDTTHEAGGSIVHPDKAPTVDYPDKAPTSGILSAPNLKMHPTGGKRQEAIVFSGADVSRQVHENQPSVVSVLNSSTSGGMIHRNTQNRLHGVQGRTDNRSKGRSNFPKDEEWRKKPLDAEFSAEGSYNKEDICEDNVPDPHASVRSSEKSSPDQGKVGGDFSALDTSGHQRAKMRETVAERSKQLQKEEEERTREQKARALAKLEELNRRSLAETSTEKVDGVQHKGVNSQFNASPMTAANASSDVAGSASGWDCDIVTFNNDYDTRGHEKVPPEAQLFSEQDPTDTTNLTSLPLEVEAKDVTDHSTSRGRDSIVPKPKQVGHKRKQNMNKNLSDKSISNIDSGHVKGRANVAGDVDSSSGQVSPHGNTNATDASLLKHKKKNSKSGKSKHKLDEVPSPKLVQMDGNSVKPSSEINSLKTSVSVFEVGSVQVPFSIEISETQDPVVSSTDQGWSLSTEGVHGVVNNQLKPHPRRMPRSTQGTRITEKFYGSDSVVWAPVGALKKNDGSDAAVNSTIEVHTSSVTGRGTHSNNKSRRAEMERYVPKPVAKELSGLGSSEQPPSSSFNQAALTVSPGRAESVSLNKETSGPEGSSSEKAGLPVVSKIGESKPNKHGKTHGLWRPRITSESISVQPSLEEPCNSLAPSKAVQKSFEQQQTSRTDLHLSKEQAKYPDIVNASISPTPNEPITDTGLKDQRVTSRGKRQSFKGHRGAVNIHNSDQSDLHGWETSEAGSQSTYVELKKLDGRVALGENHADDVHALSHWQPKSQAHTTHDHQRNSRGNGGHRDSSRVGKASKKDYPTQGGEHFGSRTDKDHSQSLVQPHSVKSNGQKTAVAGVRNVDHQEFKPEGKGVDSPKQGSHFADHHPANPAKINEQPENVNNQHEQSFSGLRRQGHQNRVSRVHEVPQGVQNPGVQDSSKQPPRPNSGRRRQDSQYEYHRARPNGNESTEPFEEGSRYRERGQTHSKHVGVNSYARNSGAFRVAPTSSNRQQSPETVGSVV